MTSTPDQTAPNDIAPKDAMGYLVPILSRRQQVKYWVLSAIWLICAGYFWVWWLSPSHVLSLGQYLLVTSALVWFFLLQIYFIVMFLSARRPVSRLEDLGAFRAAMIVTKTPSEPFSIVRETLLAMLNQTVEHDTWLADEDPSPETIAWCEAHGVKISTRKDRPDYHRKEWPRRTRCKEGNLAFFYDHYGYDNYDFVAQLDADHVPEPTYLQEMLRPFANPRVGYVSAPSMCSSNAAESWAARSRLHTEAMFHGVFQAGLANGLASMCIGSHYAVRTKALKEVGGLGPELAEDHSTTMILNAGGWRGAHAIDAIAHGAGPGSISDLITQEFQWSRSLVTLLLRYTPRYFGKLPMRLKILFAFSQLWYPLFALFMALMFVLPILALLLDVRYADVTYPQFIGHVVPASVVLLVLVDQIRRDGLFRPYDASFLSWEKILFPFVQWPWILWGCSMAVWDRISGGFVDFRITPKGEAVESRLPMRVVAPYVVLPAVALASILMVDDVQDAKGFYILGLLNTILYVVLLFVILVHHLRESSVPIWRIGIPTGFQFAAALALAVVTASAFWIRGEESLAVLLIGLDTGEFADSKFVVSGAGSPPGKIKLLLNFGWNR